MADVILHSFSRNFPEHIADPGGPGAELQLAPGKYRFQELASNFAVRVKDEPPVSGLSFGLQRLASERAIAGVPEDVDEWTDTPMDSAHEFTVKAPGVFRIFYRSGKGSLDLLQL